ncbi:MAG: DUF3822 family protein [Bacteroidales bacterium]|nr:DUF3822 family protein [Bacteroidales bacterium]
MSADRVFTLPEFQKRYDEIEISAFTPKFTLVPDQFFRKEYARQALADVVSLGENDLVESLPLENIGAVAVYSNSMGESLSKAVSSMILYPDGSSPRVYPELYWLLRSLENVDQYNKVLASYAPGRLFLVVSQGRTLLLASSYEVPDFTTAEYYIFAALKKFQLNPELSSIYLRTPVAPEDEVSLYQYFKSVELL